MRAISPLDNVSGVILDLDGVLYRGDEMVPGAPQFLDGLKRNGVAMVALTNHSGRSEAEVSQKLQGLGLNLEEDRIITSATVTARYCATAYGGGVRLTVFGSPALEASLAAAGLTVVPLGDPADVLVVGYTSDVSISRLNLAVGTLLQGAALVGTNPDLLIPDGDRLIPETGPLIKYLEAATGSTATVLGKPYQLAFALAVERLGVALERIVMVGDSLHTDMAGAAAHGIRSIWLNSSGMPGEVPVSPTRVAASLKQALAYLA